MSAGKGNRLWISEAGAVRHICEVMGYSEADARKDLRGRIADGDVKMRGRRVDYEGSLGTRLFSNMILNGPRVIVEWGENRVVLTEEFQRLAAGSGPGRYTVTGIQIFSSDLFRLWPQEEDSPASLSAPSRGGRPARYDWAAAGGFLSDFVVNNDPSKAEAAKALREWFRRQGKRPHFRELERFVAEFFRETGKTS